MQPMCRMYLLGLLIFPPLTSGLQVVLGRAAVISCNRNCSNTVVWQRNRNLVVSIVAGKLRVAPEFKDRIEFSFENLRKGNVSLVITNTVYNDRSWYMCSCDGHEGCDQYLDVLLPVALKVAVGDQAKLPCYAETNKLPSGANASVRWEKDGAAVVKLEHGEMEFGAGFKGRASVSKENYSKGDLSLTIYGVKLPDTGLYRCFHQSDRGTHPEVIDLIINDSLSSYSTIVFVIIIIIIIIIIIVVILALVFCGKLLPACRCLNALPQHSAVPMADGN